MPRRWIDPSFFTDEKLAKATLEERHLFAAMIANQDDDGRLLGHPGYLRSIAFPYDDFSNDEVKQMRDHLAEVNPNVIVYENADNEYVQLKRHHRYQHPRYYHPSKFPAPPGWPFKDELSQSNPEVTNESPQGNAKATEELPHGNQAEVERYTEDRVGRGKGGVGQGLDLDKGQDRTPSVSVAVGDGTERHQNQIKKTQRLKPHQQEAGVFLDLVERDEGIKLLSRPKLISCVRRLFAVEGTTSEKLLEFYRWLKQNDTFLRNKAPPQIIEGMRDRYPSWVAGKLKRSIESEQKGAQSKGQRGKEVHGPESFRRGKW